jgi:hypothetical protein
MRPPPLFVVYEPLLLRKRFQTLLITSSYSEAQFARYHSFLSSLPCSPWARCQCAQRTGTRLLGTNSRNEQE